MSEANLYVRIPDQSTREAIIRFARDEDRSISNTIRQLVRDGLVARAVLRVRPVDEPSA
jgi:hypothetical protein